MTERTLTRFWKKVDVRDVDDCWLWIGASHGKSGYGTFYFQGRHTLAHRAAWEIHNGPIPEGTGYHGTCVCHSCDVRLCVNPAHLFIGTQQDNIADREAKGRNVVARHPGETNGMSKLTEDDVRAIRERYVPRVVTQYDLADEFGVSQGQISGIIRRKRWTHI